MHVFISYKREEEAFARRLHDEVESWGFEPWLDVLNIQQGEEWDHAIHAGMRAAEIVIGVLTPASLTSKNVLDEWGYALSTDKRLFLLWLQNVPELDIPPRYIRIQRIDCRRNLDDGIAILQRALQSAAKIVPVPEPVDVADTLNVAQNSVITEELPQPAKAEPIVPVIEPLSPQTRTNRERMLEKVQIF
ncbi:MAG: toll/interleukin-1 receptor domain-containing protein [Anaerolineae bacterium]|nr:toll/interleukin-1 receptor domain-containing protein [Anaerolineae bacterium]